MSTAVMWSKSEPDVEFQYGGRLSEFHACHPRDPQPPSTLQGAATGRIQRHVIPQPHITLQGAATWWIHCHDSRATCHIVGSSHLAKSMSWSCHIAGCNNSICHIKYRFLPYFIYFWFFKRSLGFEERQLSYRFWYICFNKKFSCRRELEYFAKSLKIIRNETVE